MGVNVAWNQLHVRHVPRRQSTWSDALMADTAETVVTRFAQIDRENARGPHGKQVIPFQMSSRFFREFVGYSLKRLK